MPVGKRTSDKERRALRLLANATRGCTQSLALAPGFQVGTLRDLVDNGLATAQLSAEYRQSAAECRALAQEAKDEADKQLWLTFAEQWLQLADEAERSAKGHTCNSITRVRL
jgi:hypothetical protein